MQGPEDSKALAICNADVTRRELMSRTAVAAASVIGGQLMPGTTTPAAAQGIAAASASLDVILRVNGAEHSLALDPRTTLLDALREHLHLNGSKKGCGLGQCGAVDSQYNVKG